MPLVTGRYAVSVQGTRRIRKHDHARYGFGSSDIPDRRAFQRKRAVRGRRSFSSSDFSRNEGGARFNPRVGFEKLS
jgi:hypothetical protein